MDVRRVFAQSIDGDRAADDIRGNELVSQWRAGDGVIEQSLGQNGPLTVRREDERPARATHGVECVEGPPQIIVGNVESAVAVGGGVDELGAVRLSVARCIHGTAAVEGSSLDAGRDPIGVAVEGSVRYRSIPATADVGQRMNVEDVGRCASLINGRGAGRPSIAGVVALRKRAPIAEITVVGRGWRLLGVEATVWSHGELH